MNKAILVGRLVRDPELREGSSAVVRFTVAVGREFKDKDGNYGADFINCVGFGKQAEFVAKYFKKGSLIGVSGRINTGNYTNKDGQKVYTTDIAIEKAEFVGGKNENGDTAKVAKNDKARDDDFLSIPDTVDDVPFT